MERLYFTIPGTGHYYGNEPFAWGQKVYLYKEPENPFDSEAIRVELPGLGKVGYVANSVNTRIGESWSAGRLFDKISDGTVGIVRYVLQGGVVCSLKSKSLLNDTENED